MANYRKVIAVCGVWLSEEKEYGFISELNRICKEKGYVAVAFNFSMDSLEVEEDIIREKKLMELMEHFDCAAVIVLGETIKSDIMIDYIRKTVERMKVPAFSLQYPIEGCIHITQKFGEGFKNIVRHVIEHHGCRRVNMIAGVKDNDFSLERVKAYKEVLEENGIPFEEKRLKYGEFWDRPARIATDEFLKEEVPEAIVCANDAMAIACTAVLREQGYRVPEDVIVTGFDGLTSAKVNYPPISTVAPDNETEVRMIFDILDRIENGEAVDTGITRYVDYKVTPDRSCGCGKKDDKESIDRMSLLALSLNEQKWHMMAMNKLMLIANEMHDLKDMTQILADSVGLWSQHLYFVSVYEQFLKNDTEETEDISYVKDDNCVALFRMQDFEVVRDWTPFREEVIMPGLKEVFRDDNGYDMFMVRLLHTKSALYGYVFEGFRNVDERCMRRCEEFGLFLSTAINSALKNQKLLKLNERLTRINREIERVSILDYLTELYNRRGFYDELYKLVGLKENQGKYLTFFSIDMDGLKVINDNYGHNEGDFALKTLASAIRHFAVRNGICARYGGDEFVCAIITEQRTGLSPDTVRGRFKATFDKNRALADKPYAISASIGSRCELIEDGMDVEEIMRKADEEMYRDKLARRKNRD
ncbi:MAG: GGDEF domain-containing protein [Lachnospiraceae bacterium]|nr:GGDEF domain-containing protein [Lachnospiraceae bacterium]